MRYMTSRMFTMPSPLASPRARNTGTNAIPAAHPPAPKVAVDARVGSPAGPNRKELSVPLPVARRSEPAGLKTMFFGANPAATDVHGVGVKAGPARTSNPYSELEPAP